MDNTTGASVPRYRVLLVSSSGGVLLDLLALKPWWSRHDVSWVAVRAEDTAALLTGQRVHWEREQSARRPLGVLAAAVRSVRMLRRERPDVIISSGTGVAVGVFLAARVLRIPALWLETFNLVDAAGMASKICCRLAAAVLVQRPALVGLRPRAVLIGELY
jgi:hypothetical protein